MLDPVQTFSGKFNFDYNRWCTVSERKRERVHGKVADCLIFSRPIVSIARVNLSASIISLRFLDALAFTAVRFGGSILKNVSIASS